MGRALKPLAFVALAVAAPFAAPALVAAGIAAGTVATITSIAVAIGVVGALDSAGSALGPRAGSTLSPFDPKSINLDPATPRKLAFGLTPLSMDVRYVEPSGTDQEYVDYIVALAAHKCQEVDSIYIEEDLAWTPGGGAVGKFVGYLTVEVILEAGPSAYHTVNSGAVWGSTRRLTGCTTMKVRVKRSDNSKSSQSPFANGIGGRWTVIGRGMPVYDPALDGTRPGGSGPQRINDQTTWAYWNGVGVIERGNNPALQLLAFLLGWKINGVVSVGVGLDPDAIDVASFATAAAICDESVALNGGGTQRRYEAGRTFSDADDPRDVVTELLKAMNGELTDDGGRLALRIAINDLTPAVTLTDDDFVSGYSWQPQPQIDQQYTVVRGRFVQPFTPTLFSFTDFPEVAIPRTSNAPRPLVLELTAVQEQRRAERIAKQAAQRQLYQGTLTVTLGVRGWLLRRNMVVAVTSNARGWTAKLFRVRSLAFNDDATVECVLREEHASIYAWDRNESALVTPVTPVVFDSRKAASWLMADIAPGSDVTRETVPQMPRGEWASGTVYAEGDLVQLNAATYAAKQAHTAATGNKPPTADFWSVVSVAADGTASRSFDGVLTVLGFTTVATFSVRVGTGGTVELSSTTGFEVTSTSPSSNQLRLLFQRWTGSVWTDVGTSATSASTAPGGTGTLTISRTFTGTAGTLTDFRLQAARIGPTYVPGTAEHEVIFDGNCTGAGA